MATPNNKSGKSKVEPEEIQTHPDVTSGSRSHMVNPQDLADKLHGLSSSNRQPVQNLLHQGDKSNISQLETLILQQQRIQEGEGARDSCPSPPFNFFHIYAVFGKNLAK